MVARIILETSIGRARGCCDWRAREDATTQRATARKAATSKVSTAVWRGKRSAIGCVALSTKRRTSSKAKKLDSIRVNQSNQAVNCRFKGYKVIPPPPPAANPHPAKSAETSPTSAAFFQYLPAKTRTGAAPHRACPPKWQPVLTS